MRTTALSIFQTRTLAVNKALGVGIFTILLCLASLIKIPLLFTPVPVTLQNLVVFSAGALLGPVCGIICVAFYIGIGILGAPLFANGGAGIPYLFGPTGGYLLGFLAAAGFIGYVEQLVKTRNIFILCAVMGIGMVLIYCFGGWWLALGYGWGLKRILFLGVMPFVIPDAMKVLIAAALCHKFKR
jgi:biotin transport system substrate-specific component